MSSFGRTAGGRSVPKPYRPSLIDFSSELSAARHRPVASIPTPIGWSCGTMRKQLLLDPPSAFAEIRSLFGFIASIGEAESTATESPFLVTVVDKLFPLYGSSSEEVCGSLVFTRVNAWASKAFIEKRYQVVRLGIPLRGYLTPKDRKYLAAQPNCWPHTSFLGWKSAFPRISQPMESP